MIATAENASLEQLASLIRSACLEGAEEQLLNDLETQSTSKGAAIRQVCDSNHQVCCLSRQRSK